MDKIEDFWGGSQKKKRIAKMTWVDKVHKRQTDNFNNVKEFNITEKSQQFTNLSQTDT